ncbi:MAG: ankyrin repeat domain-containing protein [Candidatus Eremiobacteraeota bacterium]|nr:ankyrin repeat domain-containing protein [Candidatus Eremiobacteraeota bacterium]
MKKKHIAASVIAILLIIMMVWIYDNIFIIEVERKSLAEGAASGDVAKVTSALDKKPQLLNKPGEDGRTLLHIAAVQGHTPVVKLLVERGADLNVKTADGKTPLKIALESGKTELAEYLKSKGAKE